MGPAGPGTDLLPLNNTWTGNNTFNTEATGFGINLFKSPTRSTFAAPSAAGYICMNDTNMNLDAGDGQIVFDSPATMSSGFIAMGTGTIFGNVITSGTTSVTGLATFSGGLLSPGAGANSFRAGTNAGAVAQGSNAVAVGGQAGSSGQLENAVAIGYVAGMSAQGVKAVALGYKAGQSTQGDSGVAVGQQAGETLQGNNSVAVGDSAGNDTQGASAVAIGQLAGNDTQGVNGVAVGIYAGYDTQGINSVAVGSSAGQTSQATNAVGVGVLAGSDTQGASSVAIGNEAARYTQGDNAVAVGKSAGVTTQGTAAVAIGESAGGTAQGNYAVAIGRQTGMSNQSGTATAVGYQAGSTDQGSRSVAMGYRAGYTSQGNNGIIINSSGDALDDDTAGHIHIASSLGSIDFTTAGEWTATDQVGTYALNRLPLDNTWTGTNAFNSAVSFGSNVNLTAAATTYVQANGQNVVVRSYNNTLAGRGVYLGATDLVTTEFRYPIRAVSGGVDATGYNSGAKAELWATNQNNVEQLRLTTDAYGLNILGKMLVRPTAGTSGATPFDQKHPVAALGVWQSIQTFQDGDSVNCGGINIKRNTLPAFLAPSDVRLKENIVTVDPKESMELIKQVRICDYDKYEHIWNRETTEPMGVGVRGVIAQEYMIPFPDGVSEMAPDDPNSLLAAMHDAMQLDLVNSVKYLEAEREAMKARIEELEAHVATIIASIGS